MRLTLKDTQTEILPSILICTNYMISKLFLEALLGIKDFLSSWRLLLKSACLVLKSKNTRRRMNSLFI
jgi:hypothetical protein